MSQFPLHDQASSDLPGGRHRRRQHVRGDPGGRGPSPPQAAAGREEMNGPICFDTIKEKWDSRLYKIEFLFSNSWYNDKAFYSEI